MDLRPQVVSPAERIEPQTQQTPGIHRQQAFASDDRWVGFVRTEPGDWSGWHHHVEHDTYFFVLQGGLEFEYGGDRATIAVGPGDFAHMPGNLIHRERTPPGEPVEAVVVRIGLGPPGRQRRRPDELTTKPRRPGQPEEV